LIVDDEPEIVEFTKKRLETSGYTVITATDGETGLERAVEEKPDLILLDVMMPKKDGMMVLRQLQDNTMTQNIPVIMLSAKGDSHFLMECTELGAVDYFIKPCEWDELLKCIEKYL